MPQSRIHANWATLKCAVRHVSARLWCGDFVAACRVPTLARYVCCFPATVQKAPIYVALCLLTVTELTGLASRAEASEQEPKTVLAVDFDFAASAEPGTHNGGGGAIRVGRKLDLLLISLTPEVGGSYHNFAGTNESRIYRGFLGGRVGIGKIFEPSAFAHVGLARLESTFPGWTAPAFDGGIAFDFTLLPVVDLGAHASYNALLSQGNHESFEWLILGLHAALEF